ncbi:MAG: 2-hydroxyglutaryl-CoA dehydratase [Ruminococcaceae bacterium]|nr:2-hydroxyglutaryl-CoA dehydratase [Oscillospiraceae bacterium]
MKKGENGFYLGIDIGSTTAKLCLVKDGDILYKKYSRHLSCPREKTAELLKEVRELYGNISLKAAVSGSAGLGIAQGAGLDFVQEVFATSEAVKRIDPDCDTVIELGGEDAKIIFLKGTPEERMNGSCAGGTGAFIDQMATLLDLTADELDEYSLRSERLYPIASRCGVFAKSDIQPLLNQGASKADIAASIYQAVVNQTVAGLARGRKIEGKVMFLGGPLYFNRGLRKAFKRTLCLSDENAVFPDFALVAVAMGAALYASGLTNELELDLVIDRIEKSREASELTRTMPPLFDSEEEYEAFRLRHCGADVARGDIASYSGKAYLGIDCGSTTTKLCLISEKKEILYSYYASNKGEPVRVVLEELKKIRGLCSDRIAIASSAVTGYGEELITNAFGVDMGVVETIAHFTAAKHFLPEVEFILDIGGQDIKCFKIKNGTVDSIMLNEACSSGCGSFLETFANSLGKPIDEFAKMGIFGKNPVDLGSRCTVFMNSMVKQCQKDGASVEDISAGLSCSVVKNALYKVIRASSADELGKNIVVQGGTFYNDAVLRAFEKEIGKNVVRPVIAGLMGAYGAAIYSMRGEKSTLLSLAELESFEHHTKNAICRGCANSCRLTVNEFSGGRRYISGNRCEKGAGLRSDDQKELNIYSFKHSLIPFGENNRDGASVTVGLVMCLSNYELYPLWLSFFKSLGVRVILSGPSDKALYEKGQFTIPSDTVCYPAKLFHGHVAELCQKGADIIFYPSLSYNINEGLSVNCYNCPVVAYYGELLSSNADLRGSAFLYPFLDINDLSRLTKELYRSLRGYVPNISQSKVRHALKLGFKALDEYRSTVRKKGEEIIKKAREQKKHILVLAGRPYHCDPEINHGIDKLCASLGFAVVSEDAVAHLAPRQDVEVLDQWTYHSRLYRAAAIVRDEPDMQLCQLVSFGCGVDAVTTDEVRRILEEGGKLYTQLKIDEISNLGAVKIRLRSLLGAMGDR